METSRISTAPRCHRRIGDALLRRIILASQHTPFRGCGDYSKRTPENRTIVATDIGKGKTEAADFYQSFLSFGARDVLGELLGKTVLDFGSGYGGRTVALAQAGADMVWGTEPFLRQVDAGRALADEWGVANVRFEVCGETTVPFPDQSFDAVFTFDVLEHVRDPRLSLRELRRILKPGGRVYAIFPLYRGAFSHHLDYITLMPGLHLLFSPDRIMRVVNELSDGPLAHLASGRHAGAWRHYRTGKPILPMLNGMGLKDFQEAAAPFKVESLRLNSIAGKVFGYTSLPARLTQPLMALPPALAEPLTFNVATVLRV